MASNLYHTLTIFKGIYSITRIIQTIDKLLLQTTDGNFLFFEWIQDKKGMDKVKIEDVLIREFARTVNNRLPLEAALDIQKMVNNIDATIGSEISASALMNVVRDYIFSHLSNYINELGILQNQILLVCIFKYFIENANESQDFFKHKTVSFKEALSILDRTTKMLDVILIDEKKISLKLVREDIESFMKSETNVEKEKQNLEQMKQTSPQLLYELFIKNTQK